MTKILTRQEVATQLSWEGVNEGHRCCTKNIAESYGGDVEDSYAENQLISKVSASTIGRCILCLDPWSGYSYSSPSIQIDTLQNGLLINTKTLTNSSDSGILFDKHINAMTTDNIVFNITVDNGFSFRSDFIPSGTQLKFAFLDNKNSKLGSWVNGSWGFMTETGGIIITGELSGNYWYAPNSSTALHYQEGGSWGDANGSASNQMSLSGHSMSVDIVWKSTGADTGDTPSWSYGNNLWLSTYNMPSTTHTWPAMTIIAETQSGKEVEIHSDTFEGSTGMHFVSRGLTYYSDVSYTDPIVRIKRWSLDNYTGEINYFRYAYYGNWSPNAASSGEKGHIRSEGSQWMNGEIYAQEGYERRDPHNLKFVCGFNGWSWWE